ncbi:MAG: hypothetical protein ACPGUF_07620, partial [Litorivicinus sp.]
SKKEVVLNASPSDFPGTWAMGVSLPDRLGDPGTTPSGQTPLATLAVASGRASKLSKVVGPTPKKSTVCAFFHPEKAGIYP